MADTNFKEDGEAVYLIQIQMLKLARDIRRRRMFEMKRMY